MWIGHAAAQAPTADPAGAEQEEQAGAEHSNLVERATDPTQSPLTLRLKADVIAKSYSLADGTRPDTRVALEFQPIIPFTVWGADNILRLTVPVQVAGDGPTGLDDVQVFDLVVIKLFAGRLGVGAVANLAARDKDVPSRIDGGPAIGFVAPAARTLNLGLFVQNVFGNDTAVSAFQPIVALELGHGWSLSTGELQVEYDWKNTRFLRVPFQGELGKVLTIAKQPIRLAVGVEYNFKDLPGAERFSLKFKVEMLLPRES